MYPIFRLAKEFIVHAKAPPLVSGEVHVSYHICWPWDLDIFWEMNNGRVLTIYDLGRMVFGKRVGLLAALRNNGWGMTMAGANVQYRARLRMFQRVRMHSTALGRDARFFYLQQSMWRGEKAISTIVYRAAITNKQGIVPTKDVTAAMGQPDWNPELPVWVQEWIKAEAQRPWPPEI